MRETRSRADKVLSNAQLLQGFSSGDESANSNSDSQAEEGDDTEGSDSNEVEEIMFVHDLKSMNDF